MPPKTGPKVLCFGAGGISQGIGDALPKSEVIQLYKGQVDVTSPMKILKAVNHHQPEMIVNCAGVSYPTATGAYWGYQQEIQVNLIGAFNIANVAPEIPQVHIASVAGLYGKPAHAGYSASKAGVISMVQSYALEGLKIWAISPGRVDTPMRERDYPGDTPGSRLLPVQIGAIVRQIMDGEYEPGTNVVIRKVGLEDIIIEEHHGDGWREKLRVGEPVTI